MNEQKNMSKDKGKEYVIQNNPLVGIIKILQSVGNMFLCF